MDRITARSPLSKLARFELALCLSGICAGCSGEGSDNTQEQLRKAEQPLQVADIVIRRSLVVTEKPILERFSLERVLTQLAAQSGVPNVSALSLFNQWWDTQNPKPGLGAGPHCDDESDPGLGSTINGYPYLCRPAPSEGGQASCDPFAVGSDCAYIPIALFNRFDQAPEDGSHCGEHRIVFAKASGVAPDGNRDRNTLIFEANMDNPLPHQGLKGCRKIVDVWADLTGEDDIEKRADALEIFYFDGQGTLPPVVSVEHFGDNARGLGQVRTNQFVNTDTGWSMREYKLLRECSGSACSALRFVPVTNKVNPFGGLFDPASTHPKAAEFRAFFPTQVASLAVSDINAISMQVPDEFNTAQSQSSGAFRVEMDYVAQLGPDPSELRTAIEAELTALSSSLTVEQVLLRAQTTTCAGCHRLSSEAELGDTIVWPAATPRFVHVTERETEVVNGVERFVISVGLDQVFLPHRKSIMDDFLNNKPRPPSAQGPQQPISGSNDHG